MTTSENHLKTPAAPVKNGSKRKRALLILALVVVVAGIAWALWYLLVARWAGLSAAGVAMPDHFLVRLHGVRPVLVDPLHGGRTITKVDCARHLRASGHDQVREHLRDLTDREVLIHYLRGLQRAAAHRAVPETQRTLGHALSLLETR